MQRIICPFECKTDSNDSEMIIRGYGSTWDLDSGGDVIARGAFKKTLEESKSGAKAFPAMLLQHGGSGTLADDKMPLGIWISLEEDSKGLTRSVKASTSFASLKIVQRPAQPCLTAMAFLN
jgi:HK97 family phage prohead protease